MRCFHIIRVNLQLRLGAHLCRLTQHQVSVRLMRFRLLGIRRDLQIADKTAAGVVLQYKLDELVGCTAAYAMRHMGLGRHVVFSAQVFQAIYLRGATLADLVHRDRERRIDDMDLDMRISLLLDVQIHLFVHEDALICLALTDLHNLSLPVRVPNSYRRSSRFFRPPTHAQNPVRYNPTDAGNG